MVTAVSMGLEDSLFIVSFQSQEISFVRMHDFMHAGFFSLVVSECLGEGRGAVGFLTHWRKQPKDEQGSLLPAEDSTALIDCTEPSRKLAYGRLHDEIKERGGTRRTHATVNKIANEAMLSETTEDLYQGMGLKQGDRVKLPTEAKEALMTGDLAARHQIVTDDAQDHYPIVHSARKGYRKAAKLFPWNQE